MRLSAQSCSRSVGARRPTSSLIVDARADGAHLPGRQPGASDRSRDIVEFPAVYTIIGQFAFGLGGLLAIVYAAAYRRRRLELGRHPQRDRARRKPRANYLLAKGVALAIVLAIATAHRLRAGHRLRSTSPASSAGVPVASPLRGNGLQDLVENIAPRLSGPARSAPRSVLPSPWSCAASSPAPSSASCSSSARR